MVADRQGGDLQEGRNLFSIKSFGIFGSADTGCQRVSGINGHIHDGASLYAIFIFESAFRVYISFKITIVFRIGIDDTADGAMFLCYLGFDASPGMAVFSEDDLSFYGDPHSFNAVVLFGNPVVDEYHVGRHVSVRRPAI